MVFYYIFCHLMQSQALGPRSLQRLHLHRHRPPASIAAVMLRVAFPAVMLCVGVLVRGQPEDSSLTRRAYELLEKQDLGESTKPGRTSPRSSYASNVKWIHRGCACSRSPQWFWAVSSPSSWCWWWSWLCASTSRWTVAETPTTSGRGGSSAASWRLRTEQTRLSASHHGPALQSDVIKLCTHTDMNSFC